jgi:UDP-N-acetylglucosamine enolpyruvyl transferase
MISNELYPKDLRAAASLLIECIIDQKSQLHNLYYLERGYDSIYKKLKKIGLKFELE